MSIFKLRKLIFNLFIGYRSENVFDYYNALSQKQIKIVLKICTFFKIPKQGIVFVFDIEDHQNYPDGSIWRNLGNHLNIRLGDGKDMDCPPDLKNLINEKRFSNLIWIANRAWAQDEIDLVWNLSHELRHLEHDCENRLISLTQNFICENLNKMDIEEPKIANIVPTEMDAELTAWKVAQKVIKKKAVDAYVQKNEASVKFNKNFRLLLENDPNKFYDVREKTISLLIKYKPQFDKILQENKTYYWKLKSVDYLVSHL